MPTTMQVKTPQELAMMDVSSRRAYFASLPAAQQAQMQSAYNNYKLTNNRQYMKNTVRKLAPCPANGGAFTATFAQGQTLPFQVPTSNNAFLEGFLVRLNLSVTPATGTSAAYALNAAAPLSLIDRIIVQFGGVQAQLRPYILKYLQQLQGRNEIGIPYSVVAGQSVAWNQTFRSSGTPLVVGSANTWNFEFYVPLNAIHPQDARGLLPIMASETNVQVLITCAPQILGVDPILHTIAATTGSGHAVTTTGNVTVTACYRDGVSYNSPTRYGLDLTDIGTTQYALDLPLNNLVAGSVQRQKIAIMDKLYWVISTIVDGNQSNKFCANSNIAILEADQDSVGANVFWRYGTGSNVAIGEFFTQQYFMLQQDLDEGIIPWVQAPIYGLAEPSNLEGTHILDTSTAGWTDFHYGCQLNTVGGVAGIQPRIETHVVLVNSASLVQV